MAYGWNRSDRHGEKASWTMVVCGITLIVPVLLLAGWLLVRDIQFDRKCEGYLKRAADSNTIQLAEKELSVAILYIEESNMIEGFTSVIYETPDEDVGFWYTNLRNSLDELQAVKPEATPLERSNILMKLRETLLDDTSQGVTVTTPKGISRFPYNTMFAVFVVLGIIAAMFGAFTINKEFKAHAGLVEMMIVVAVFGVVAAIAMR